MADEAVAHLSRPGPGWRMLWPTGGMKNFQLDIVGFLAILGEDAVKKTSRLASLSPLFLLPRLIPAPHSLLYSERPEQLEVFRASVTGVGTGLVRGYLSHVAGAIFGPLPPFTVRCCEIRRVPPDADQKSPQEDFAILRAKPAGPMVAVNVFGCALSILLLCLSVIFGDGMSLLATLLLSGTSVFVGITNRWQMKLPLRGATSPNMQSSDIVIRWPNGSFLVVRCDEDVASHLFFGTDNIDYTLSWPNGFIFLSLFGTLFLMTSVIALANAKIQLQIAWATSYVVLNIAHWLAAALPRKLNWDFSAFVFQEIGNECGPLSENFTEALFKVIVFTKSIDWVRNGKAAPETAIWDDWLGEAESIAKTLQCRTGGLINPVWGTQDGKGLVYEVPSNWKPKQTFDRIYSLQTANSQGQGV